MSEPESTPESTPAALPTLWDSTQVGFELGLSERTVETRSEKGHVPGYVRIFDRHPRWKREVIQQWIADGCPEIGANSAYGAIEKRTMDELQFASLHTSEDINQPFQQDPTR